MTTILRVLIFAVLGWLAFQILLVGMKSKMRSVGKAPIAWPALFLAKIGVGISMSLMLWAAVSGGVRLNPLAMIAFLMLLSGGVLFMTPSLFGLGRNLRVGLPDEQTDLVTTGVYGFSRNPIYVGIFLIMGASLVYAFSWFNAAAVATGMILHHRIIIAEEKFLAVRFKAYEPYRARVRRYL